ncbi:hypothetical protein [Paractinoplanes lichenicola]|uniref:Uncharacterized protein n=1 Tax=Paractinoplanes lichenicola TaxID=2802976 RepID=A0ABS1VMB3_9ACTN|nr:hypothetical protein [Actinoplanes lichenicola]MBL7255798.1 hypothetical protein [Actinoplanes lichenicola]
MGISRYGARWLGSRPHLVGAAVALVLVVAALLGVLETFLRPNFGLWPSVVIAGYLAGWLLTGLVLWLPGRGFRKGVTPRSWLGIVLPELDQVPASRRTGVREKKTAFTIGMVVFVAAVLFFVLLLMSPERADAANTALSGVAALAGLYTAWQSNARPSGERKKDPPTGP